MLDAVLAPLNVGLQQHFGVRCRRKPPAVSDQLLPQFDVVEDFTVERDDEFVAFQNHRLRAASEVDNAQPSVAQPNRAAQLNAIRVRPAMIKRRGHRIEYLVPHRLPIESLNSRDAAYAGGLKFVCSEAGQFPDRSCHSTLRNRARNLDHTGAESISTLRTFAKSSFSFRRPVGRVAIRQHLNPELQSMNTGQSRVMVRPVAFEQHGRRTRCVA